MSGSQWNGKEIYGGVVDDLEEEAQEQERGDKEKRTGKRLGVIEMNVRKYPLIFTFVQQQFKKESINKICVTLINLDWKFSLICFAIL